MIGIPYSFIFRDGSVVVYRQLNDAHARQSAEGLPGLRQVVEVGTRRRVWSCLSLVSGGAA